MWRSSFADKKKAEDEEEEEEEGESNYIERKEEEEERTKKKMYFFENIFVFLSLSNSSFFFAILELQKSHMANLVISQVANVKYVKACAEYFFFSPYLSSYIYDPTTAFFRLFLSRSSSLGFGGSAAGCAAPASFQRYTPLIISDTN